MCPLHSHDDPVHGYSRYGGGRETPCPRIWDSGLACPDRQLDNCTVVAHAAHRLPFAQLLHRDLELSAYFDQADRLLDRSVPFDASCWLSLDPDTLLPTSHYSREYGLDELLKLAGNEFLEEDFNKFAVLARASRPVGTLTRRPPAIPGEVRVTRNSSLPWGSPMATSSGPCSRTAMLRGAPSWSIAAAARSATEKLSWSMKSDRLLGTWNPTGDPALCPPSRRPFRGCRDHPPGLRRHDRRHHARRPAV